MARLGAVLEVVAQPVFTWLFGLATYGIYVALWAAVKLASYLAGLAMTEALQRLVPVRNERDAHAAVKIALLLSMTPTLFIAILVSLNAELVAGVFSAAPENQISLPQVVSLFVWALPLWTFVEVTTSAVRARRAFGPEIRVRIFWEQSARIVLAIGFFSLGYSNTGLIAAHLASLSLTAVLCIALLGRFYNLRALIAAPISAARLTDTLLSGVALLPSNLSRRALIDGPTLALNVLLPGSQGAVSAGIFEIARKISTIPHIVRYSFQYVLAPLASAQARIDRVAIGPLYQFAAHVSAALVMPLTGLLIFGGRDILSLYRPEVISALPLLIILVTGRAVEAVVGPAQVVIEMTGHRALPLLNSVLSVASWAVLTHLLVGVHGYGALGMAIAVAVAVIIGTSAAAVELAISTRLSFDMTILRGIAISCTGIGLMALAEILLNAPARVVILLVVWALTSWFALNYGLTARDKMALGVWAGRLRLLRA